MSVPILPPTWSAAVPSPVHQLTRPAGAATAVGTVRSSRGSKAGRRRGRFAEVLVEKCFQERSQEANDMDRSFRVKGGLVCGGNVPSRRAGRVPRGDWASQPFTADHLRALRGALSAKAQAS